MTHKLSDFCLSSLGASGERLTHGGERFVVCLFANKFNLFTWNSILLSIALQLKFLLSQILFRLFLLFLLCCKLKSPKLSTSPLQDFIHQFIRTSSICLFFSSSAFLAISSNLCLSSSSRFLAASRRSCFTFSFFAFSSSLTFLILGSNE